MDDKEVAEQTNRVRSILLSAVTPHPVPCSCSDCKMKCSQSGIDLIKQFEGCSLIPYRDLAGYLTVGYGHRTAYDRVITQEYACLTLANDVEAVADALNRFITVGVTQNQFDALCSLAYNIGVTAVWHSTLLRELNESQYRAAADQFLEWCHAGGRKIPGLLERRQAERSLFLKVPIRASV